MGPYSLERKNLGLLLCGLCMLVWLDVLFSHSYFMLSWCVHCLSIGILNTMSESYLGRTTPPHIDITVIEVRQCTILLTLLLWTAERRDFPVFCAFIGLQTDFPWLSPFLITVPRICFNMPRRMGCFSQCCICQHKRRTPESQNGARIRHWFRFCCTDTKHMFWWCSEGSCYRECMKDATLLLQCSESAFLDDAHLSSPSECMWNMWSSELEDPSPFGLRPQSLQSWFETSWRQMRWSRTRWLISYPWCML